jgi:hypothetical protein
MLEKAVGGVSWAVRQKRKVQTAHAVELSVSALTWWGWCHCCCCSGGGAGGGACAASDGGGMQGSTGTFTPVSGPAAAAGPGDGASHCNQIIRSRPA